MTAVELLFLAIGLSMDACAVAMSDGMCHKDLKKSRIAAIGLCFGGMQGVMPLLGYFLGAACTDLISSFDHYIALVLLGFIGVKMLYEALRGGETGEAQPLTASLICLQGIATSIDALAVGVSLAALQGVAIWPAAGLIAGVTCVLSILGVLLGKRCGMRWSKKAQILGGLLLLGIGLKIFIEHMWLS